MPVEIKLHKDLIKTPYCVNVYPSLLSHQGRFSTVPIVLNAHSSLQSD